MAEHTRNVTGLRTNAQKKRIQTLEKTEEAIKKLIKENKTINFNSVAETANVSKAWLYKESEIKERIQHLRQQQSKKSNKLVKKNISNDSKDSIIKTLKNKSKKLEQENKQLQEQIQALYGELKIIDFLKQRNQQLERENKELKTKIEKNTAFYSIEKEANSSIYNVLIENELHELKIKLNTTLIKTIKSASDKTVLDAIEALKDQLTKQDIPNAGGWLNKAISEGWTKSETTHQQFSKPEQKIVKAIDRPKKEQVSLTQLKKLSSIFNKDE